MAKVMIGTRNSKGAEELSVVNPRSAGIDVGSRLMQVCIPREFDEENNRGFGTTTDDLEQIVGWLKSHHITHAAMEATGVYWIPLFNMLSRNGIEAVLLNAADVKNYSCRKTDVSDAEWLMVLMRYGMVKPSFQVDAPTRRLRNLTRHRDMLSKVSADNIRRTQKILELMNVKLAEVLSEVMGCSGRRILEAILGGCRDASLLAEMASARCAKSRQEIAKALEGTWDEELLFMLGQEYSTYLHYVSQKAEVDTQIEMAVKEIAELVLEANCGELPDFVPSGKQPKKKNAVGFDIERLSSVVWGVNLAGIDGVSGLTVLLLMGELGHDFTSKFKDAAHFCSWCNLAPKDKVSGGKILSSKIPKRVNRVGLMLRNCAMTLAQHKGVFGQYFRRMKSRGGGKFAVCATAHKLAKVIYTMVQNKTEYDAAKISVTDEKWLERRRLALMKELKRIDRKMENINC